MQLIRAAVNGEYREIEVPPERLLVDFLRYDLGLTGTKEACGIGVCGVCTVLVNGQLTSSCLLLAVQADGKEITTIEGMGLPGQLDPLQQAFMENGGFQCGICTSGQIITARALLLEKPAPSEAEVRDWMMGNLCRCTGYYGIVRSVLAAANSADP